MIYNDERNCIGPV